MDVAVEAGTAVPSEGTVGSVLGAGVRPAHPTIKETLSMPPINMPAVRRITDCGYDTTLLLTGTPLLQASSQRPEGDAHAVLGLGVLDARLHGGDIVRLWTIPVSVSRINEYSPSPTDPRSQRGFRFSFNFEHIMVNFH